jgi:hypothetical protein
VPSEWKPARRAQIDRDGRWTIKRGRKREAAPGAGHKRQIEIAVGCGRNSSAKSPAAKPMPAHLIRDNATRARVRSGRARLRRPEMPAGPRRAHRRHDARRVKIGLTNLAYNFSRLAWLQAQTAPA